MITLTPVVSTSIAAIGYDAKRGEAHIVYRESGRHYVYADVPPATFAALAEAPSKGTFVNRTFKPQNHNYREI